MSVTYKYKFGRGYLKSEISLVSKSTHIPERKPVSLLVLKVVDLVEDTNSKDQLRAHPHW